MAKLRTTQHIYEFTSKPGYHDKLARAVQAALPTGMTLSAGNYARSTASSYWLLRKRISNNRTIWLTLRVATHHGWLRNAEQSEVLWQDPGNFEQLTHLVSSQLTSREIAVNQFELTAGDIAALKLLKELERHQLIWFIQMKPDIFEAHKGLPFDLQTDFIQAPLMIGDRNNANHLLEKVIVPKFQSRLAIYFGENLLFSQFTKHHLLKLLPTNQWIEPMLAKESALNNWQNEVAKAYGNQFVDFCLTQMAAQR